MAVVRRLVSGIRMPGSIDRMSHQLMCTPCLVRMGVSLGGRGHQRPISHVVTDKQRPRQHLGGEGEQGNKRQQLSESKGHTWIL